MGHRESDSSIITGYQSHDALLQFNVMHRDEIEHTTLLT